MYAMEIAHARVQPRLKHAGEPARFLADFRPVPHLIAAITATTYRCLAKGAGAIGLVAP